MQKKPAAPRNKRHHFSSDNNSDDRIILPAAPIIGWTASEATSTSGSNVVPPSTGSDDSGNDANQGEFDPELMKSFLEGPTFHEEPNMSSPDTVCVLPPHRLAYKALTIAKQQAHLETLVQPQARPLTSKTACIYDRAHAAEMQERVKGIVNKSLPVYRTGILVLKDLDGKLRPAVHDSIGEAKTAARRAFKLWDTLYTECKREDFNCFKDMLDNFKFD